MAATLGLALGLLACASIAPGDASRRLAALVAESAACADAECQAAADAELLALADRTTRAAGRERDPARRLALLRITGVAAWQAGAEGADLAEQVADFAMARCRILDEMARVGEIPGAPDDCLVLETLPALVAHAAYDRELASLAAAPPSEAGALALERSVGDYPPQTFLLLRDIGPRLRGYTDVEPALLAWLAVTERALFCDYRRTRNLVNARWPENEELARRVDRELERAAAAMRTNFDACPEVSPVALPPSG